MVSAVISPVLFKEYKSAGVYAFNQGHHKLTNSTLFDNCGALNLINKILKLESGTFIKATKTETVKSGLGALPILRHRTHILKGILNRASSNNKRDLILKNIAVVEGFYTNIISKAKLLLAGV
jgi:hypothetical protein